MAHRQVGARTEGDVYQGLFFWRQAAALLIPSSRVVQVALEYDDAAGFDDVAVFYELPGIDAGGWRSPADFYQLKYHVDRRDAYSADALVDPSFINAKSSLLQRFFAAYKKVETQYPRFRLHLASNWRWRDDDALASVLREFDGQLPDQFFTAGSRSQLGQVREKWRAHLSVDGDSFETFARSLRLQLDHFGRRDFRDMVHDRLAAAGLRIPDGGSASSPYESLYQQFLMSGPCSFSRDAFRDLCQSEGLLEAGAGQGSIPTIGVRSFLRFAERLEEETDEFVCAVRHFEGRHPRANDSWTQSSAALVEFFADPDRRLRTRQKEHAIVLECHGSFALLAGYELSRNSGSAVYPVQKPRRELWKPNGTTVSAQVWKQESTDRDPESEDVAIALSVTHDVGPAVAQYLDSGSAPRVRAFINLAPAGGVGPQSVRDADHAYQLASAVVPILRASRKTPAGRVHLFASAPNSILFFVGQHRDALGRVILYEYDFGFERHGSYEPSVVLPLVRTTPEGEHNGTEL